MVSRHPTDERNLVTTTQTTRILLRSGRHIAGDQPTSAIQSQASHNHLAREGWLACLINSAVEMTKTASCAELGSAAIGMPLGQ